MAEDKRSRHAEDWSARHVRLRFEAFACALIVFLFSAGAELQPSIIFPFQLPELSRPDYVVIVFVLAFVYFAAHLAVRSRVEWSPVTAYQAIIREREAELEKARTGFDQSVDAVRNLLHPEELERLRSEMDRLHEQTGTVCKLLEARTEGNARIVELLNARAGSDRFSQREQEELSQLLSVGAGWTAPEPSEKKTRENAVANVFQTHQRLIEQWDRVTAAFPRNVDEAARTAVEKMAEVNTSIASQLSEYRGLNRAMGWDRFMFGLVVPLMVSLALLAPAIPTIKGAFGSALGASPPCLTQGWVRLSAQPPRNGCAQAPEPNNLMHPKPSPG